MGQILWVQAGKRQLQGQLKPLLKGVLPVGLQRVPTEVRRETIRVIGRAPRAKQFLKQDIHYWHLAHTSY